MMRVLPWLYLIAAFVFIYLPVGTLVLFSFQDGRLPVPPFNGPSLRWYSDVLGDARLTGALVNSVGVAFVAITFRVPSGRCFWRGCCWIMAGGPFVWRLR